jgi:hypothetical protein
MAVLRGQRQSKREYLREYHDHKVVKLLLHL